MSSPAFFASDLHGHEDRWEKLFAAMRSEAPRAVFLGGDLLPSGLLPRSAPGSRHRDFVDDYLAPSFRRVARALGDRAARIFLVLGNDDARFEEAVLLEGTARGDWTYVHDRCVEWEGLRVYGYSYVPPSPFLLKDWERYDVSRFVDPGCVSPEEGWRSVPEAAHVTKWSTIAEDLDRLTGTDDLERAVFLFHAPPYDTCLDRADLDGKLFDGVPLDVHIGSIAIRRFLEKRQPRVSLHGHVHEAARLTGEWRTTIGRTHALGAAHDGAELALVRFDPEAPEDATRELL